MSVILKYRFWISAVILAHITGVTDINSTGESDSRKPKTPTDGSSHYRAEEKQVKKFIEKHKEGVRVSVKSLGDFEKEQKKTESKCEDSPKNGSYEGVGVTHTWDGVVTGVAEGYAADKSGITIGDEILGFIEHSDPDNFIQGYELRGKEGTSIDVAIRRGERILKLTMTREKICYEQDTP